LREKLVINPKDKKQTQAKRIFFARRGIRRKYNQHQVFDILKKHDFTQVYMEDLSLKDQISLMSNAENIIGPTGASWTNIIFCHTGVKCLLWMPDMASEFSAFSNLAELVGARLNCITYKVQADSLRSLYFMDYSVNLKEIHKELLTLLDS
jgi:capsular polysaccharide biosynthesis protein